jgi:2'-5' RNA ligase
MTMPPDPDVRPASIWLQLEQEASLRALIRRLAHAYGTVPFQPHLTVCSVASETLWDAAADYVRQTPTLPIRIRKKGISFSTTTPMMAVVIDIDETADLRVFRDNLRQIVNAPEPHRPHISLLYSVDKTGQQPGWSSDRSHLERIADDCARCVDQNDFVLGRPIIVSPDRRWLNIDSWHVVRALHL